MSATKPDSPPTPSEPPAGPALTEFSCDLVLVNPPASLKAGTDKVTFQVKMVNRSKAGETWPALLPGRSAIRAVNLASHWNHGEEWKEGERTLLPADLKPGQSVELPLKLMPPATPGDYVLKVEPVQEAVAWFSGKGGCFKEVKVKVTP